MMFTHRKFFVLFVLLLTIGCAPPPPERPSGPADNPPEPLAAVQEQPVETAVAPSNPAPESSVDGVTVSETAVPAQNANLPVTATDCPTDTFINVQPHPANSAYPDPILDVSCTDTELIIHTNNIPNFEFVPITPNALGAQDVTFRLPLEPTNATITSAVPLVGAAAIAVNGLLIFGPTEAPRDGSRDPYLDQILDYCNGHTAPGGIYHFHARPDCLYENMEGQTGLVLAYAFDGYPILAPYICADVDCTAVTGLQSSWQDVNPNESNAWERHAYVAGSGDLDECNGLTLADGAYVYFATDTFPYFMGCYRGVLSANASGLR